MTGFIRFNGAPAVRWAPFAANPRAHAEFERAFAEAYGEKGVKKTATELRADVRENATAYIDCRKRSMQNSPQHAMSTAC